MEPNTSTEKTGAGLTDEEREIADQILRATSPFLFPMITAMNRRDHFDESGDMYEGHQFHAPNGDLYDLPKAVGHES